MHIPFLLLLIFLSLFEIETGECTYIFGDRFQSFKKKDNKRKCHPARNRPLPKS